MTATAIEGTLRVGMTLLVHLRQGYKSATSAPSVGCKGYPTLDPSLKDVLSTCTTATKWAYTTQAKPVRIAMNCFTLRLTMACLLNP